MDRKLIDYLPPVLRSVYEYKHITNAQQPEIEAAWDAAQLVLDNQFIDTADESGVAVWEKELGIIPLDNDSLDARKHRIKAAWAYTTVYTYKWLEDWLKNSCGEKNPLPLINDYTLSIAFPITVDYKRMIEDMRRNISSNILINPRLVLTKIRMNNYFGAALRYSVRQIISGEAWDYEGITILTDENDNTLVDERGLVLFDCNGEE